MKVSKEKTNISPQELSYLTKKFFLCCQEGDLLTLNELLNRYPSLIDSSNETGNTPLIVSVKNGKLNITSFLIDQGANLNKTNAAGQTVLHIACWKKMRKEIEQILSKGADINIQDLVKIK